MKAATPPSNQGGSDWCSRSSAARRTVVDDARCRSGDAAQDAAVLNSAAAAVLLSNIGREECMFASNRPMLGAKPHMSVCHSLINLLVYATL